MQFVIKTTEPYPNLNEVAQAVLQKAQASGMFFYVDTDLKLDKPQTTVEVDRDLVATLGMTQQDVGAALGAALGGGYVNYFSIAGRSYKVIPQVLQTDRLNADQILDYHIRTADGTLIPASTVAHQKTEVVPEGIAHFQQLNSASIFGVYSPAVSQDQVLDFMRQALAEVAPTGYSADYSGVSRQFVQESGGFAVTLAVRDDHRVPGAGRAVRKLPRSDRDPGVGADGAVRRADLHQSRILDASTSTRRSGWSR